MEKFGVWQSKLQREEEGAKISWTPKAKQFRVAFIVYIEFLQLFIFAVGSFSDIFYL